MDYREICYYFFLGIFFMKKTLGQNGRLSAFQALDDMRQIPSSLPAILNALATAVPGKSYPTLSFIPDTAFNCGQVPQTGYYADPEAGCQVFRQCLPDGSSRSFICANQTLFNQITLVCDWWYNVDCSKARSYYSYSNPRIYQQNARFLDDGPSTSTGPISINVNLPPVVVPQPVPAVALPVTSTTTKAATTLTTLAASTATTVNDPIRPLGRSLTSPITKNADSDFYGNMNGPPVPTAFPVDNSETDEVDWGTSSEVSEESPSVVKVGTPMVIDSTTVKIGTPLVVSSTEDTSTHEISDVSAHRNFKPPVKIQLNPVFSSTQTNQLPPLPVRQPVAEFQRPNAADSIPQISKNFLSAQEISKKFPNTITMTKNHPLVELNPITATTMSNQGRSTSSLPPTTEYFGMYTQPTSTVPTKTMTEPTTTSPIPFTTITQLNSTMVGLDKVSRTSAEVLTRGPLTTTLLSTSTMVIQTKKSAIQPLTTVVNLNQVPSTTPINVEEPLQEVPVFYRTQPTTTTTPKTTSKPIVQPITTTKATVTMVLHNNNNTNGANQSVVAAQSAVTVVRVRKELPVVSTTDVIVEQETGNTEAGLYKQIPWPDIIQQQQQQKTVPKSSVRDFRGNSPSFTLLLTLRRLVSSTNDFLNRRIMLH